MTALGIGVALVLAYLLGSVSGALVLAPLFGQADIRASGSHNAGATNALREGGAGYAVSVLVFDLVKGAVAVVLVVVLLAPLLPWPFVCGFVAVLGHVWPVFHGFRGGKGAATAMGVLSMLLPEVLVIAVAIFGLVLVWRRIVSLAVLCGVVAAIVAVFLLPGTGTGPDGQGLVLALGLLLVHTHRDNITRLRHGTEPRFGASGRLGPENRS